MNAIHIRRTLDSEVLHIPELKPLIGKTVEIVIREEQPKHATEAEWDAFFAQDEGDLIDPEIYKQLREYDRLNWKVEEI